MPKYNQEKKYKKRNKNFFYFFVIFLSILLSLIVLLGLAIKKEFNKTVWDRNSKISFVLNTNPVAVSTLDPKENTILIIIFPQDIYEETPNNLGTYKLTSLWKLGNLEKKQGLILAKTLQNTIGTPIDGWIGINDSWNITENPTKNDINLYKKKISNLNSFTKIFKNYFSNNFRTNFSIFDILSLRNSISNIRSDKIVILNLGKLDVTYKLNLPDGSKGKMIDKNLLENITQNIFEDKNIKKEGLSINVKNATNIIGLGAKFSRIINKLGAQVVKIDNTPEKDQSICYTSKEFINSFTLVRIKKFTNCDILEKEIKDADIEVIIGKKTLLL